MSNWPQPKSHLNDDEPKPFQHCSDETRVAIEMLAIKLFEHDNARIELYEVDLKTVATNWLTLSNREHYRKRAIQLLKEPLL